VIVPVILSEAKDFTRVAQPFDRAARSFALLRTTIAQ